MRQSSLFPLPPRYSNGQQKRGRSLSVVIICFLHWPLCCLTSNMVLALSAAWHGLTDGRHVTPPPLRFAGVSDRCYCTASCRHLVKVGNASTAVLILKTLGRISDLDRGCGHPTLRQRRGGIHLLSWCAVYSCWRAMLEHRFLITSYRMIVFLFFVRHDIPYEFRSPFACCARTCCVRYYLSFHVEVRRMQQHQKKQS